MGHASRGRGAGRSVIVWCNQNLANLYHSDDPQHGLMTGLSAVGNLLGIRCKLTCWGACKFQSSVYHSDDPHHGLMTGLSAVGNLLAIRCKFTCWGACTFQSLQKK